MIRMDFTLDEYNEIVEKAMLKDHKLLLDKIFYLKIKGYSNIEIQMELNLSEATLARRIKILKKKIMKVL